MMAFRYHPDEAYNAMKALYGLHSGGDFWSDQPDGLYTLHVTLLELVHPSLSILRAVSLAFSASLLASLLSVLRSSGGWLLACLTLLVLVLSSHFIQLSVAALIGLPAYALALAGAVCLVRGNDSLRPSLWAFASAVLVAFGAHIKFSALLVMPALLLWFGCLARFQLMGQWRGTMAMGIWLGCFSAVFLVPWLLKPESFWLIVSAHWGAGAQSAFAGDTAPYVNIGRFLSENYLLTAPAVLGLLLGFVNRRSDTLIPGVWFITALLVHLWHRPFWPHHFLHLSVPMAWLAGLFIGEMAQQFKAVTWERLVGRPGKSLTPALSPVGGERAAQTQDALQRGPTGCGRVRAGWAFLRQSRVAAWIWVVLPSFFLSAFIAELPGRWEKAIAFTKVDDSKDWECVRVMKEYRAQTKWVFADDALYPFHAGMLTPPEIAVLSNKRLKAGLITQPELLNLLVHYRAEQVLVRRRVFDKKFMTYVGQHYTSVFEHGSLQLYVRNDLMKAKIQADARQRVPTATGRADLPVGHSSEGASVL